MDADRNTGANPSRESLLAGTGDSEAVEDPDSQAGQLTLHVAFLGQQ